MRKKVFGKHLSRSKNERRALFRALIRSLVIYGEVKTTKAKAKAVIKDVEKIVKLAKKNTLAARRSVYAMLGNDRDTTQKLFDTIAPALTDRVSGYTKMINLRERSGDRAQMVRFFWSRDIVTQKAVDNKAKKEKAVKGKKVKTAEKSKVSKKS